MSSIAESTSLVCGTTRQPYSKIPKFGSSILTINVAKGSATRTFAIHEDIAIKFSDFLAAAVRNDWTESRERVVNLPEENPNLFDIFVAFIYSGRIFSSKEADEYIGRDGNTGSNEHPRLAKLWTMGERLLSSPFKDAVVDALIDRVRETGLVPLTMYQTIYRGSARPSPMRELQVHMALWEWDAKDVADADRHEDWMDFFVDLATLQQCFLVFGRPNEAPYEQETSCRYHEHDHHEDDYHEQEYDKPCYKTMFEYLS